AGVRRQPPRRRVGPEPRRAPRPGPEACGGRVPAPGLRAGRPRGGGGRGRQGDLLRRGLERPGPEAAPEPSRAAGRLVQGARREREDARARVRRGRCSKHMGGVRDWSVRNPDRVRRAQARFRPEVTDLIVAGAGMAGLAAAARARELGARVELYEKAARIGGSMLLSSGVVWRYASFE